MAEENVPIKAAQQRLGHSRPDLLLIRYAHLLENEHFEARIGGCK
jgi:hypothetical protein